MKRKKEEEERRRLAQDQQKNIRCSLRQCLRQACANLTRTSVCEQPLTRLTRSLRAAYANLPLPAISTSAYARPCAKLSPSLRLYGVQEFNAYAHLARSLRNLTPNIVFATVQLRTLRGPYAVTMRTVLTRTLCEFLITAMYVYIYIYVYLDVVFLLFLFLSA